MNRIIVDVVSASGDVLGSAEVAVFLDDDGNLAPLNPAKVTASRMFVVDHIRLRAISGRLLAVARIDGRNKLKPKDIFTMEWPAEAIKIVP